MIRSYYVIKLIIKKKNEMKLFWPEIILTG